MSLAQLVGRQRRHSSGTLIASLRRPVMAVLAGLTADAVRLAGKNPNANNGAAIRGQSPVVHSDPVMVSPDNITADSASLASESTASYRFPSVVNPLS
jgi:hypothetical protein